jgi:NADH-quinone oxidoreductase E subunit
VSQLFSDGLRDKIVAVTGRYPRKQAALLPVLHLVQGELGFISSAAEKSVAGLLDLKPIQVREVVTFYTMFLRHPIGRYHIQVCANLTCTLLGSEKVLAYLENKLGLKPGQTTPDGKFTLSTVECLGACERSPCLMVNERTYGDLDADKLEALLGELD